MAGYSKYTSHFYTLYQLREKFDSIFILTMYLVDTVLDSEHDRGNLYFVSMVIHYGDKETQVKFEEI